MYSRAHIVIERELEELERLEPDITVLRAPTVFELVALVSGPRATPWREGVFQVNVRLDETYNERPPLECYFNTVPFHPNVDAVSGRPSLDCLDVDKWSPQKGHSLRYILTSLRHLLSNPLLDRALNMDAVFVLKGNPAEYERITRQTVLATQDIRMFLQNRYVRPILGLY
jgi:ubiquitin-protein ligase